MPPAARLSGPQPDLSAAGLSAGQATYRAIGTEPFWDLEIGRDLIFTDRGNNVSVQRPDAAADQRHRRAKSTGRSGWR